jgi:hypothetical protein
LEQPAIAAAEHAAAGCNQDGLVMEHLTKMDHNAPLTSETAYTPPRSFRAVVVVLSKEFVHNSCAMAALHLLLELHVQDPKPMLLPIPCDISWSALANEASAAHMAAARDDHDQQQPQDLQDLKHLKAFSTIEVSRLDPVPVACTKPVSEWDVDGMCRKATPAIHGRKWNHCMALSMCCHVCSVVYY